MMRHVLWVACVAGAFPLFSQTVISPGANVQTAINNAPAGSTLLLNAGTYTLSAGLVVNKSITIASNTAGQRPVLQFATGTAVGVDIKASNVRLDSLRIANSMWGVYAGNGTVTTPQSNITIKNLSINAVAGFNSGHGIFVINVLNAIVDGNVIEAAPVSGIIVQARSDNATIINNVVNCGTATNTSNGITVSFSASPIVAGNTINTAGQFGMLIEGAPFARIERNTIGVGVRRDGIVVSRDGSNKVSTESAYVGRNDVTLNGATSGVGSGTGIWLNSESNGVLVYGNRASGAAENGLTIFNSSNSWFWGNVTTGNAEGGIFVYGPTNLTYSVGPAPSNNFIQGNYAYSLPFNGGVNLNLASNSTVFNNMFRANPVGVMLQKTTGDRVFLNLLQGNTEGVHAYPGATGGTYFLNRHLNTMANVAEPGSAIAFDAGSVLGGNFQPGARVLSDTYPYSAETLGRAASVNVTLPVAGTVAGAGTRKSIEWRSTGCTYVDLYYKKGGAAQQLIVNDYPDVGVYQWTVPAVAAGSDYTVVVTCNNSAGASLGVSGSSGAFTIAAGGLELLSPQGNHRVAGGATTRVTWARTPATTGAVNVQYRSSVNGALTTLASNVTDNQVTVTVPAGGTPTGMFVVTAANGASDSSDGFVNVTDTTPTVIAPSGAVGIGTLQLVQWASHNNSRYVDIDYLNTGTGAYTPLVTNLPDFGRFYVLIPGATMTNTNIRVRFKDENLAEIGGTTATSGGFNTVVAGSPGGPIQPPPPPPPTSTPDVISLTPAAGSGVSGTFTATYRHPGGKEKHYLGYMLFLPLPNIVSFNAQGTCLIEYNRISNGMRLIDNPGTGWIGPLEGVKVLPSTPPLSNNACTVNVAGTTVTFPGNDMVITVPVTFKTAGVTTVMGTFLQENDVNGQWTDFRQFGNWNVPGAGTKAGSYVLAGTPTAGAGSSFSLTATVGNTNGAGRIGQVHIRFGDKIVGSEGCHAVFFPGSNTVALVNDANTGIIGPVALGTPLSNSRCGLGAGGTASSFGNNVTVTLPFTFNPGTFAGTKNVYVNGFDVGGGVTHWVRTGTFTVQ